jgi:hypothetical protein
MALPQHFDTDSECPKEYALPDSRTVQVLRMYDDVVERVADIERKNHGHAPLHFYSVS